MSNFCISLLQALTLLKIPGNVEALGEAMAPWRTSRDRDHPHAELGEKDVPEVSSPKRRRFDSGSIVADDDEWYQIEGITKLPDW